MKSSEKMIEEKNLKNFGEKGMPIIRNLGSSAKVHTGLWRTERPVIDLSKCIRCKTCWIFCPDSAMEWKKDHPQPNYWICKGCGICAEECPVKCISMVKEKMSEKEITKK